ncbi:hypothetical protein PV328_008380 [Microctonus aethiopoides]|uniref:Uncharacterized protein n=1 Tax=Microctonus aethiopoides TaxID=144406 RepID=A0AA39FJ45_9HYME|nr:hypothetical protein PV328_008380 [Microctonus aethiopoides]
MVCPNLRSSHEGDTLVFAVEQKTLWFQLPRRRQTDLYRSVDNAVRNTMDQHIPSIQSRLRSSNGPVEQARGRRGLLQTSWEAQLPVDHADPTDRTIIVVSLDKIIWWRRRLNFDWPCVQSTCDWGQKLTRDILSSEIKEYMVTFVMSKINGCDIDRR